MKTIPSCRAIIYPKDIQRITGKSERQGRKMLTAIRKKLGKEDSTRSDCFPRQRREVSSCSF